MNDAPKRWQTWAAAALLASHATIAWIARSSASVTMHSDEATYIWLARALRQLSYRDIYLVDAPVHAQYPPGFPAFLAAVSLPFGEHFAVLIASIIAVSALALALLYDVVRRTSGANVALAVLALSALNPGLLLVASKPYSEPLFMLFSFATLWFAARQGRHWVVGAGVCAIAAALTRSAGVTLVVALFVAWILERQYRRAFLLAAAGAATVGSWLAWTVVAPAKFVGRSYIADAVARPANAATPPSMVETLLTRVSENLVAYGTRDVPWSMSVPTISGTIVDNVFAVGVLFIAFGFGLWRLRRALPLAMWYVVVYATLLLVWPWSAFRFVVPIVPLLMWAMLEGFLGAPIRFRALTSLVAAATIVLLSAAIVRDAAMVKDARACFRRDARDNAACYTAQSRGFFKASDFLRDSVPASTVVVSLNEALLAYQSSRAVLSALAIGGRTPAATFALMRQRHVEHIMLTRLREPAPQLVPTLIQGCNELEVVREYDETLLLRIRSSTTGPSACDALARYASAPGDRRVIR